MFRNFPNKDRAKRIQELRRSSAAHAEPDRHKYSRRVRHKVKQLLRKGVWE